MKLYAMYNGYMGCAAVRVLVVAKNEERARRLAKKSFEKQRSSSRNSYDESYSEIELVEVICDDLSKEFATEPFSD